ncbi:hypothetical protein PRIPAC_87085 [Pristionchus pacificus]|uniref:Uncharacterized protein n=1 Tax=Pristionchus pacificus TaxID=54126 RepID=A0A2A6B9N0_PRIPA|nr:hypothetical protein PRIPAC_87085 [Pristionchus pacificus]|eukprot:PDM62578.1 hypothetical protein PRIPAC_52020 [Pristionchus pacificus]
MYTFHGIVIKFASDSRVSAEAQMTNTLAYTHLEIAPEHTTCSAPLSLVFRIPSLPNLSFDDVQLFLTLVYPNTDAANINCVDEVETMLEMARYLESSVVDEEDGDASAEKN